MDWDLLKESDEIFASNDCGPFMTSNFDPLPPLFSDSWNQLDFATSTGLEQISTPHNFEPAPTEDLNFNSAKVKNINKEPSQQVNGLDFGSPDPLEEWIEGLSDCQLLNLDQMDGIFPNSFSDEDIKMISPVEPSQTISNPLDCALSFESNLENLPNKPLNYLVNQNSTGTSGCLDASTIPLLSEDLSVNSFVASEVLMPSEVSVMLNARGSTTQKTMWVGDMANKNGCDATILQNLEAALLKINGETRICFRDALYRMANSSERLKYTNEKKSPDSTFLPPDSRLYGSEQMEDGTNVIDRAVANLMFNPPCGGPSDMWVSQTSTLQHVGAAL